MNKVKVGLVCSAVIALMVCLIIFFPKERYIFTAKLTDVEAPSLLYPAYLTFDNGKIISWEGNVERLVIGHTYRVSYNPLLGYKLRDVT